MAYMMNCAILILITVLFLEPEITWVTTVCFKAPLYSLSPP